MPRSILLGLPCLHLANLISECLGLRVSPLDDRCCELVILHLLPELLTLLVVATLLCSDVRLLFLNVSRDMIQELLGHNLNLILCWQRQINLQVARLLLENNQIQQAIAQFKGLHKVADIEVAMEACYRLGMHYISNQQIKEAESIFKSAIPAAGGENYYRLSSLAQLASIYENQGKNKQAISTYELLANSTNEERWTAAAQERIQLLRTQSNQ